MDVLIVGGGIGGLTAALSLHAAGIVATVVESVSTIRPLGAGINLQPHAVRELTELGLGDALAATAVPTAELVYVDQHGQRILTEPCGLARGYRWPQYSVHRGELQMTLVRAVRERLGDQALRTGTRVEAVHQTPTGVRTRVRERGAAADETVVADLVVGADGLHSVVRSALHPDEPPLSWSGTTMWRGVTEAAPFLTGRSMIHTDDGGRVRFIAYPISRSAAEQGRALVNWVGQVAVAEPGPLAHDADWNRPGRLEDVLPHYRGWDLGWLDVPDLLARSAQILEYPMVDRDPLPWWGVDRVTLLGDAAHPMYPVGANGASQAVVDARVLAYALATTADPVAALRRYEDQRRGPTGEVVLANRRMDRAELSAGRVPSAGGAEAPQAGRTRIYAEMTSHYRNATGSEVQDLNQRPSLTPPNPAADRAANAGTGHTG